MSNRRREFKLTNEEIREILFGVNSEDEEDLHSHKEDIGFLEEDILDAEENGFENANVVIEPASAVTIENIVENTKYILPKTQYLLYLNVNPPHLHYYLQTKSRISLHW